MELKHTFTVPAPVETAWATLLDVEGIAPCFPGAALTSVEGDEFAGTVKVKLGPVSLQYAGKGRFVERDEAARRVVLEAHGSDKRGNGTAGATVHARLEPAGDDRTTVVVETDLKVTGRPAQFGRGVLQDVGGRIIEQFATCLASRMAPEEPAAEPAPEPAAAPTGDPAGGSPAAPAPTPAPVGAPGGTTSGTTTGTATETRLPEGDRSVAGSPYLRPVPQQQAAAELDLGSVVLPTLVRRFGPVLVAGLIGLVIGRLLRRRRA